MTIIREPPKLLSTEHHTVDFLCVTNSAISVFVKCGNSIRILPFSNTSDDNCDAASYTLQGSEIAGGVFRDVDCDTSRGVVLNPSTKYSAAPGVCLCLKPSTPAGGGYTVGLFEPLDADITNSRNAITRTKSGTNFHLEDTSEGDPTLQIYKLRRRLKLKKGEAVANICPMSSSPSGFESNNMAVLVSGASNNDRPGEALSVQIVSTGTLEVQISSVQLPPISDVRSNEGELNIVYIPMNSTASGNLLVVSGLYNSASGSAVVCFLHLLEDQTALVPLGWYQFEAPASSAKLTSLQPVPISKVEASRFSLRPNILVTWSSGDYELFAASATPKLVILSLRKLNLLWGAEAVNHSAVPLFPSIVLEAVWDRDEGSLCMRMQHINDGVSFVYPSNGTPLLGDSSSCVALGLPAAPPKLYSTVLGDDVILLMSTNKQIYCHLLRGLCKLTSASLMPPVLPSSSPIRLPKMSILKGLQFSDETIIRQAVDVLSGNETEVAFSQSFKAIDEVICRLVEVGLISLTTDMVDRLLKLGMHDCCSHLIKSTLVSEEVIVHLMRMDSDTFLCDIIRHLSANRAELIKQLRQQLSTQNTQNIFSSLALWCSILTGLPPTLSSTGNIPPLNRVSDFVSILIDAKFRELSSTDDQVLVRSVHADALVVKKNLQKLQGQLHSVIGTINPTAIAHHRTIIPQIEKLTINM